MLSLQDREWKNFFIEDELTIKSGKRLTKADMKPGKIPFVGASDSNNGITAFVSNENESTDQNILGVNYNGSVVETFYHPYKATFSDDVKRIGIKKTDSNDKYTLLFLKQCILQQKSKYAYGYKFNAERMKRQKILLPITLDGVPDWQFMSDYMKEQEKRMLEKVLPYFKDRLLDDLLALGAMPDTTWGGVRLGDLFNITIGKTLDGNKIDKENGRIPYVTRKETNNGVDGFTEGHDEAYLWDKVPVITIGNETAKPFVQTTPFYTGTKVNILSPKRALSAGALKFIARCFESNRERYSYSYTANSTRLAEQRIILPLTDSGALNHAYMEQTIAKLESDSLSYVTEIMQNRYEKLVSCINIQGGVLTDRDWKAFGYEEIFKNIGRGKRLKKDDHIIGKMPYVSSTAQNNGVDGFVGNDEKVRVYQNCLTVANSGSVGTAFYQPFEFVASDHVTALGNSKLNEYSYQFLATLVFRLQEKYSFNREINDERIRREQILLPVSLDGDPDWQFMSDYMRAQEALQILNALKR